MIEDRDRITRRKSGRRVSPRRRRGSSTIRDVAHRAGVSVGTVSAVLNERSWVRVETRARVKRAIEELGYRPNTIARSLNARKAWAAIEARQAGMPKLTTFGYISVDFTARVPVLPHRDDRITAFGIEKSLGGPAANVAVMAAALGGRFGVACELATAIGDDLDSEWALAELAARQVETIGVERRPGQRISRCVVLVEPNGTRTIVNEPFVLGERDVRAYIGNAPVAGQSHCVHLEGYQVPSLIESVVRARSAGFLASVQSTGLPESWRDTEALDRLLGAFDVLFLNREVARSMARSDGNARALVTRLRELCLRASDRRGKSALVFLTLGESGAVLLDPNGQTVHQPAPVVDVVDTTGAGDTFAGVFLATWLSGEPPQSALRYAVVASSHSVAVRSAQGLRPTAADLELWVEALKWDAEPLPMDV